MADNYLEKQYEDYQAKKAAWEWERKYGKKNKKAAPPRQPEPELHRTLTMRTSSRKKRKKNADGSPPA